MGLWDSIKSGWSAMWNYQASKNANAASIIDSAVSQSQTATNVANRLTGGRYSSNVLSARAEEAQIRNASVINTPTIDSAVNAANQAIQGNFSFLPNLSNVSSSAVAASVSNLVELYARQQLGIETAYQYDQNVATAQQALKQLMAGYRDQARIPATAYGSNAYGDLATLDQYGFTAAVYTPTAGWAAIIDDMITAGGQTIDDYFPLQKLHQTFDYYQMTGAEIINDPDSRPVFVRNMMIDLLASGVTIWYVKDGDISDHYGNPYKVTNEAVS